MSHKKIITRMKSQNKQTKKTAKKLTKKQQQKTSVKIPIPYTDEYFKL